MSLEPVPVDDPFYLPGYDSPASSGPVEEMPPRPPPPDPEATPRQLPPRHEPDGPPLRSTWAPIDLTDALAGHDVDPPTLLERTDGLNLLYPGRVHWLAGESESCKSWVAQHVAAAELAAGRQVLYIDFEDDERGVVARLKTLGLTTDQIAAGLTYLRPDEALTDRRGEPTTAARDLGEVLADHSFTLAIIDGITEAITLEGLELIDNADVARWMRLLPKRIAAGGAAVVAIDHLPKHHDTTGRFAIGAQHKLAGVTGAAYKLTTRRPLARATGSEPVHGEVSISLNKDRPGWIRGRIVEGKVGLLSITSYPDGGVTVRLDPPGAGGPDQRLVRAILEHLDAYDGVSKNQLEKELDGKGSAVREARDWLVGQGWIRVEQKGRSHLLWLTELGREQLS